ncbi:hypothetical protein JHK82_015494 [Glycine max]|uniref:Uncharacterized protein n=2 Tax=Glycine subgen. Soja TaxID=1462606 RepID=A0A0R0JPX4_SOYBN|nr:hypothetical protein JHK87_015425 [Glycine soja]KAG5046110.1 hypothetical protein JHK86_015516 [Glycine max]KAG5148613.1 hypothetical protein JHK82_015494 [Glycine max]KAH1126305.1 hypothetical protein GYH30_015342 [Glycine max]RZC07912.1 hypothetical protein D0Y65_014913 [Glycine soja]
MTRSVLGRRRRNKGEEKNTGPRGIYVTLQAQYLFLGVLEKKICSIELTDILNISRLSHCCQTTEECALPRTLPSFLFQDKVNESGVHFQISPFRL